MDEKTPEELAHRLMNSSFTLEKALLQYVKSASILIECQWESGFDESLAKSIPAFIHQIIELKNLISRKIMMLTEYGNETKLNSLFHEYKDFERGQFLDAVEKIYSLSKKCSLSEPARIQLREEVNQLIRVLKEQQSVINRFEKSKNNPQTIWLGHTKGMVKGNENRESRPCL